MSSNKSMLMESGNDQDRSVNIARNPLIDRNLPIRLYYVRIHDESDQLTLRMQCEGGMKFQFNRGIPMNRMMTYGPFIYTLDLVLYMHDANLFVQYEDAYRPMNTYSLKIVCPAVLYRSYTFEESENRRHSLQNCFDQQHHFILGTQFTSQSNFPVPGEETNIWTEFCLFTCYLLQMEMFDVFDILVSQLQITLPTESDTFDANKFLDIFEKCHEYIRDILDRCEDKPRVLKVILCMIGMLPIKKESFRRYYSHSISSANTVMSYVRNSIVRLFQSVNETERVLFHKGLATLMSIELLQYKSPGTNDNKVIFLQQISDEKYRQIIANTLLDQLYQLNQPIFGDINWTDLFLMIDSTKINIKHVYLHNSFVTFIISITKLSSILTDSSVFQEQIENDLHEYLSAEWMKIDRENMIFFTNFLELELLDESPVTKDLLSTIQIVIRYSAALKSKIRDYLNGLVMTTDNMEEIWLILRSVSKWEIFNYFDQHTYLQRSLSDTHASEYYIQWARYFLAQSELTNDLEKIKCRNLMKNYCDHLKKHSRQFFDVLLALDEILNAFDQSHDILRLDFINRMIDLCFQQNSIFPIIADHLFTIQNELFRIQFVKIFDMKYLAGKQPTLFKDMNRIHNPLVTFMQLNFENSNKSVLVRDLIQLISDKIEFTQEELINDTFSRPFKSTLIYFSLFHPSLAVLPIHMKIMEKLSSIWSDWKRDGFTLVQIARWNRLTEEQQHIACEIWNFVRQNRNTLEQMIDRATGRLKEIDKSIEEIRVCVETFCQDASDLESYSTLLQDLRSQFDQQMVYSEKIPPEIDAIRTSADRLRPIISSIIFQKHLDHHLEFRDEKLSCFQILEQATKILDQFVLDLNHLCTDMEQALLPQLKQLFLGVYAIDQECEVLRSFLKNSDTFFLKILLEYWKEREHINHTCRGFQIILSQYKAPCSIKWSILKNVLDIDDQTSSEKCIEIYQDYLREYSSRYSVQILRLIAQWSRSKDLFALLDTLHLTDIENSPANTKYPSSLLLLKKFLDRLAVRIEAVRRTKFLDVDLLIPCIEKILPNDQINEILSSIELCASNISALERICVTSNDPSCTD